MQTISRTQGASFAPPRSRPRSVILSCCLISLLGTGVDPSHAAFPGENGRIATQRGLSCILPAPNAGFEASNFEIFTVSPDLSSADSRVTNEPCPITGNPFTPPIPTGDTQPAYAPDGKKIAFIRGGGTNADIWVANADGSGQEQLTFQVGDTRPAFSPDGERLVFTSNTRVDGRIEVFTMKATGSDPKRLTDNSVSERTPVFSPDGKIVFAVNGDIHKMNADGTNDTAITMDGTTLNEAEPDVSPDGSKIVFSRSGQVWSMSASDGSSQTQLTETGGQGAVFSPDGTKIAFHSARRDTEVGQANEIFVMDANGDNETPVTSAAGLTRQFGGDRFPDWGPRPRFTLDVVTAGVGQGRVESTPAGIDCGAACSDDFLSGTQVTLTATPAAGSTFLGFSGAGCAGAGPCRITVDQDRAVTAVFGRPAATGSVPLATSPGPAGAVTPFAACPALTANVIRGTAASNSIVGTPRADRIFAGTGNDTVDGLAANDCIDLGPGTDRGQGGAGNDLVVGGIGADSVNGSAGNDSLLGNSGNDRLSGGSGRDRISGGSGNDRVAARDGQRDRITCGSGRDTVVADKTDVVSRTCERVARGKG